MTLLGPASRGRSELTGGDGRAEMAVYPLGTPDPTLTGGVLAGARLVDAVFDYTAHGPDRSLVCHYFPVPVPGGRTARPAKRMSVR